VATRTRASARDFTTARAAKLDNLDATVSSRLASGNVTVAGYAAGQDPATLTGVTTTRGAKLDNLDATISSRLAPAGITSLQADVTAIKTPVVANIDATISSRLPTSSYSAPSSITSLQADVTAIKSTVDTNLNATVSSRLAASAYVTAIGTGATSYSVTIYEPGTLVPISGAEAWVTSDSAGVVVIAGTLRTSATGVVTFLLDSGTYYLWVQASGWNFSNPQAFVVS
jgi:hypothetical protein